MKKKKLVVNILVAIVFVSFLTVYIDLISKYRPFDKQTYRGIHGSGSMIPFLNKNIYPYVRTINKPLDFDDPIKIGRIYIYESEDQLIVHRLIGIYKVDGEYLYIFKGDNNIAIDEPVYRHQIREEVTGVILE